MITKNKTYFCLSVGTLQVKHALGYLTLTPGGVSETELEDLLSLDDHFLTQLFQVRNPEESVIIAQRENE